MELSYLHILVSSADNDYRTRYVKGGLGGFVRKYFDGLDLLLSPLIHGRWLEPLDAKHEAYATTDVYASLMVFHRMNALRLEMRPTPPLPRRTEEYMKWKPGIPDHKVIELEPLRPKAKSVDVHTFFHFHEVMEEDEESNGPPLSPSSESHLLFRILVRHREAVADSMGAPLAYVASDRALQLVAV
jgi:hypothetical protein